jgi:hypothetical protein
MLRQRSRSLAGPSVCCMTRVGLHVLCGPLRPVRTLSLRHRNSVGTLAAVAFLPAFDACRPAHKPSPNPFQLRRSRGGPILSRSCTRQPPKAGTRRAPLRLARALPLRMYASRRRRRRELRRADLCGLQEGARDRSSKEAEARSSEGTCSRPWHVPAMDALWSAVRSDGCFVSAIPATCTGAAWCRTQRQLARLARTRETSARRSALRIVIASSLVTPHHQLLPCKVRAAA